MIVSFILFVMFAIFASTVAIQAGEESKPYNSAINKIDILIKEEMKRNKIQGLSVALVDEEGIFWSRGYGYQDIKNKVEASPRTLYRTASVTKPFTATAIMLLVDRGLVNLDTPVKEYIPEFAINSLFKQKSEITVRDLLNHHSGIKRDHYKGISGDNPPSLDFLVEELKDDYLALPPKSRYKYSNINYALLGKIIENVSGKSYSQFMQEEIFQPVGMSDTFIGLNEENKDKIARAYEIKGLLFKKPKEIEQYANRDIPAGSMISSVEDTAKFITMLLNKGMINSDNEFLSSDLLEQMFVVQYPDNQLDDDPYGLGWKVNKVNIPYTTMNIRHGGTLVGFSTLVAAAPEEKLGIVIYYNTNHIFSRHYIVNEALKLLAKSKDDKIDKSKHRPEKQREREQIIALDDIQPHDFQGRYVGIGDLPLVLDLKVNKGEMSLNLMNQSLSLIPVNDYRHEVIKEILFFDIDVGRFMGVDNTFFEFYQSQDGVIYPRLILKYEDLEMKIFFTKIQPYNLPQSLAKLEGKYIPTEDSLPYIYQNSFAEFELKIKDGWLEMNTTWEGNDLSFLLKPIDETKLVTYGSGEILIIKDDLIYYSGLRFKKK